MTVPASEQQLDGTGALGQDALVAGLHDIHMPTALPWQVVADLMAAMAVGGAAALAIGLALRAFSLRRDAQSPPSLVEQVSALHSLPAGERRTRLLGLMKRHRPDRFAAIRPNLYRRDGDLKDLDVLAQEVLGDR